MLKYHVAVCDDEKSDLDGIVQSVQQYDVQGQQAMLIRITME